MARLRMGTSACHSCHSSFRSSMSKRTVAFDGMMPAFPVASHHRCSLGTKFGSLTHSHLGNPFFPTSDHLLLAYHKCKRFYPGKNKISSHLHVSLGSAPHRSDHAWARFTQLWGRWSPPALPWLQQRLGRQADTLRTWGQLPGSQMLFSLLLLLFQVSSTEVRTLRSRVKCFTTEPARCPYSSTHFNEFCP